MVVRTLLPEAVLSTTKSGPEFGGVTGAMNRYPRLGTVSMKAGFSAESPKVSRKRLIVVFRPVSKSTNVSAVHKVDRSSSRVTVWPACSSSLSRT